MFDVPPSDDDRTTPPEPKRKLVSPSPIPQRLVAEPSQSRATLRDSDYDNAESTSHKRKRDVDSAEAQLLREGGLVTTDTERGPSHLVLKPSALEKAAVKPASARSAALSSKTHQAAPAKRYPLPKPASKNVQSSKISQRPQSATQNRAFVMLPKPPKGLFAPAQLEKMLSESTNVSRRRVNQTSVKTPLSPQKRVRLDSSSSPRTPSPRNSASPASIIRSGSPTPKQNALWSKLLESTHATDSPTKLKMKNLQISGAPKTNPSRALLRSTSDTGQFPVSRRGRLIDTLAKHDEDDEEESFDQTTSTEDESIDLAEQDFAHSQHMDIDAPVASISQGGPKFTYGQQRTYIEENNLEAELMLDSPLAISKQPSGLGYGSLKTASQSQSRYGPDEEDLEDSQGPIKSVHELRAAGGNQRFVDDFENILQDIQSRTGKSMSRQRAGIIDLCEKLSDKKFAGRMVDHGLDERLLNACTGLMDTIFNFAVAVAIAFVSDADAPIAVLRHVQKSTSFDALFSMLETEADIKAIAKERRTNMSKVAQTSLLEFRGKVIESPMWEDQKPAILSPHLMALKAIDLLVRNLRQKGYMEDILDEQKTSTLLAILERGFKDIKLSTGADLLSLELAISILESGSIIPGRIQTAWTPKRLNRLSTILPKLLNMQTPNADRMSALSLRLMLNLTNGIAKNSVHFANDETVRLIVTSINNGFEALRSIPESAEEELAIAIDRVVLNLGAIINLAEFCDSARTTVLSGDSSMLHELVSTFTRHHERAAEADSMLLAQFNVSYGWLAVALGNLCQNAQVKAQVAEELPGKTINPLIETVEEFAQHYRKADREMFDGEEGDTVTANVTERLKAVAARLRDGNH